jgi:hypothetical protein
MAMVHVLRWTEVVASEEWIEFLWIVIIASIYPRQQTEHIKTLIREHDRSMPPMKGVSIRNEVHC